MIIQEKYNIPDEYCERFVYLFGWLPIISRMLIIVLRILPKSRELNSNLEFPQFKP